MNHISSKRLRILRWIVIAYSAHFLAAYLYGVYKTHSWQGNHDFPIEIAVVVVLQAVYEIGASIRLVKKTAWVATSVTFAFALLESFLTLEPTGIYHSVYIGPILVLTFLAGALGLYWPVGILLVLTLGYLLGQAGFFSDGSGGAIAGLLVVIGAAFAALISYIFWRRLYDLSENPQLSSLDRMLKSRQQQSEILIQSIADGVIVFDANSKINLVNPAAATMTEWKMTDALGIDVHTVVKLAEGNGKPLTEGTDLFTSALTTKKAVNRTLQLIGRNNKQTIVSLVISPVVIPPDSSVVGAVAIFRDITKEHQAEQQRADFISTASHEMRTPVAAIEGYLSLALNNKVSTIDSKAREYLEKAHESTQHLGKLFQDLLTSAKAEDGRLSNHPTVVELGSLLQQLTDGLRFAAEKKQLALEFIIGTPDVIDATNGGAVNGNMVRPLYYVYADAERLREVITNLFDNAVKYTEQGKVSIGLTADPSFVQFYVRDTGSGIPADDVPHLFQKFYRVDNSATRVIGGTGLGLFIARKIVELYGGRIWVESKFGNGSTFYINLPRLTTQRAEQLKSTEATTQESLAATSALTSS